MVRLATAEYGDDVPDPQNVIEVTVEAAEVDRVTQFTVTITNVSEDIAMGPCVDGTPLSPGVWVVHTGEDGDPGPLFTTGEPDRGEGLGDIAEDGVIGPLQGSLASRTGVAVVSSPGVWAVHDAPNPLFEAGMADRAQGLEAIAEDGQPMTLDDNLDGAAGIVDNGTVGMMPIGPGGTFEVTFSAQPGDALSFVTMVVPSNDWFFAPSGQGIALFDDAGNPVTGDVSDQVMLWDAGTEVDQPLGVGLDQVQLSDPDTGADDPNDNVRTLSSDAIEALGGEAAEFLTVTLSTDN
jgi:hypothetical protein